MRPKNSPLSSQILMSPCGLPVFSSIGCHQPVGDERSTALAAHMADRHASATNISRWIWRRIAIVIAVRMKSNARVDGTA